MNGNNSEHKAKEDSSYSSDVDHETQIDSRAEKLQSQNDLNIELMEEELTCTICLDIMFQPVTTECGHTFCKQCLHNSLMVKLKCTICRKPIFENSHLSFESLPVNIVLQNILQKKYPDKYLQKEKIKKETAKQMNENIQNVNAYPVVVCDCFIYPGMKSIMSVDSRQMKDLIHYLTSPANNLSVNERKFIIVRKYEDTRGFVLKLKQVYRTQEIKAEVEGFSRIQIDQVFVPDERIGLYSNQNEALKFANGKIIVDSDPYDQINQNVSQQFQNDNKNIEQNEISISEALQQQLNIEQKAHYEQKINQLNDLFQKFKLQQTERNHPDITQQQIEQTFGTYPRNDQNNNIDSLRDKMEKQTLYVLSQLEMQNQNIDLIFSKNGQERLNACLSEIERLSSKKYEKLFVWELDPIIKKRETFSQFYILAITFIVLCIGGYLNQTR